MNYLLNEAKKPGRGSMKGPPRPGFTPERCYTTILLIVTRQLCLLCLCNHVPGRKIGIPFPGALIITGAQTSPWTDMLCGGAYPINAVQRFARDNADFATRAIHKRCGSMLCSRAKHLRWKTGCSSSKVQSNLILPKTIVRQNEKQRTAHSILYVGTTI